MLFKLFIKLAPEFSIALSKFAIDLEKFTEFIRIFNFGLNLKIGYELID